MKRTHTLYIANMSEDVWPFISSISDPVLRQYEIEDSAELGDRDLFGLCQEDNLIYISPVPVAPALVRYWSELFQKPAPLVLSPHEHCGEVCRDIMADTSLWATLCEHVRESQVRLLAYTSSPQLYFLAECLQEEARCFISLPESPAQEDHWIIDCAGSKAGFRQLADNECLGTPISQGIIAHSVYEAAGYASHVYSSKGAVALKTNRAHAGSGVVLARCGDFLPTRAGSYEQLLARLKSDSFWGEFPIVVENLIPTAGTSYDNPSIEFRITADGTTEYLYPCAMCVTEQGIFQGVEIHEHCVPGKIREKMHSTGEALARRLASFGYRGYFDIDFLVSSEGELFASESNVRRTGGTHAYVVARSLWGKEFLSRGVVVAHNSHRMADAPNDFDSLLQRLSNYLYDRDKGCGIVPVSARKLAAGQVAYVILAADRAEALWYQSEMQVAMRSAR